MIFFAWDTYLTFIGAYLIQAYEVGESAAGIVLALGAGASFATSVHGARLLASLSRPRVVAAATLAMGALIPLQFGTDDLVWIGLLTFFLCTAAGGIRAAVASTLGLAQLPSQPGSMMAARTAATQMGYLLGSLIGGATLAMGGYAALGIVLSTGLILGATLVLRVTDQPPASETLRPSRHPLQPTRTYTAHADQSSRDGGCRMDYGVHLPLIGFCGRPPSLRHLLDYVGTAETLGFAALSVNDNLLFSRPWLDGPTALSSVLAATGRMDLMTTVAVAVVRGPVALAKSMAAIDPLSGGRLVVGVGPDSSARDYDAVGVPFDENAGSASMRRSRRYAPSGAKSGRRSKATSTRPKASWRSRGRCGRRVHRSGSAVGAPKPASAGRRLGDGWLASAYNTRKERSPMRGLDWKNT
jgi:hypothetical protein